MASADAVRIESAGDGDAERGRAAEPTAGRQIGLGLDVHGADGRSARSALSSASRRGRRETRARAEALRLRRRSDRDVPPAHVQRAVAPCRPSCFALRPRSAIDADRERRHAVHDRVLTEEDHLAVRGSRRHADRSPSARTAPASQRLPSEPSGSAIASSAARASARSSATRASTRAFAPSAPSRGRPPRRRASRRVFAAEDAAEERFGGGVSAHLGDERRALALADVVADRLARRARVAERAEQVVAELERDAERTPVARELRDARVATRRRGARRSRAAR